MTPATIQRLQIAGICAVLAFTAAVAVWPRASLDDIEQPEQPFAGDLDYMPPPFPRMAIRLPAELAFDKDAGSAGLPTKGSLRERVLAACQCEARGVDDGVDIGVETALTVWSEPLAAPLVLVGVAGDQTFPTPKLLGYRGNGVAGGFHGGGGYGGIVVVPGRPELPKPVSPVPEPATWLTMILGFGLIGYTLRRKREFAHGLR